MQDIKDYIQEHATECEKRAEYMEVKIKELTDKMMSARDQKNMQMFKLERQQCIEKKHELLVIADFCNELLQKYFI